MGRGQSFFETLHMQHPILYAHLRQRQAARSQAPVHQQQQTTITHLMSRAFDGLQQLGHFALRWMFALSH